MFIVLIGWSEVLVDVAEGTTFILSDISIEQIIFKYSFAFESCQSYVIWVTFEVYGAGITVSPISIRSADLVINELAWFNVHITCLFKLNATCLLSSYISYKCAALNQCFKAHLIYDLNSWSFECRHVLESWVFDCETQALCAFHSMSNWLFINGIEHFHFIDYHIRMLGEYVLLLSIRESAIVDYYVTK